MELRILDRDEDRSDPLFRSQESRQLLDIYAGYYARKGFSPPWVAYLVVEDGQVLGTAGFTEAPRNGSVEIAYWTFSEFEGRGVASFACRELITIARRTDPGVTVTAKTAPAHNASTAILQRNGFRLSGDVEDDDIGPAWLWSLRLGPASAPPR